MDETSHAMIGACALIRGGTIVGLLIESHWGAEVDWVIRQAQRLAPRQVTLDHRSWRAQAQSGPFPRSRESVCAS